MVPSGLSACRALCVSPQGQGRLQGRLFTHVTLHFFRPLRFREKELRDEEENKKTGTGSDAGSGDLSAALVKAGDKQAEV